MRKRIKLFSTCDAKEFTANNEGEWIRALWVVHVGGARCQCQCLDKDLLSTYQRGWWHIRLTGSGLDGTVCLVGDLRSVDGGSLWMCKRKQKLGFFPVLG